MSTPRAFVGGATGHTGREVVRQLCERGVETIAHVRPNSSKLNDWLKRFEGWGASVDTSAWGKGELEKRFSELQPTLVFGLLGTTKARARRTARAGGDAAQESYEAVDYGLTCELIEAASKSGSSPCFVYLSSAGAGSGMGHYLEIRQRVERELTSSDLPYVIARPATIIGDRDESRPLEEIGGKVLDSLLTVAGGLGMQGLRERYRSTTNVVLAGALVRAALDPESRNIVLESESLRT
ncbi:MAG: NAD(P)H-binding protein [Myxococcota bacterium]|nr:NAD(P)H-binding protein [Myxococcota bacterium]